jgi:hypothetical protein
VATLGAGLALLADVFIPEGLGMPQPWVLGVVFAMVVGLAVAIERGVPQARYVLVWLVTFSIPILVRDPFLNQKTALAPVAPAALAALVAGPRTVIAAAITPIAILVIRADGTSPYFRAGYLLGSSALLSRRWSTRARAGRSSRPSRARQT